MDIASVLGVIIAFGLILGSILIGGGSFSAFIDYPSVMVVIGGAIAAAMISFPLKNFFSVFGVVMKVFFYKLDAIPRLIEEIVSLARRGSSVANVDVGHTVAVDVPDLTPHGSKFRGE